MRKKISKRFKFYDEIFDDDILEDLFIKSEIPLGTKVKLTLEVCE